MPRDFVLEIGCEEIPASFLPGMIQDLEAKGRAMLDEAGLSYGYVKGMGAPRRLVLLAGAVAERQPDVLEKVRGPSKAVAFDADGNPTQAALGFARSRGVSVAELRVEDTPHGEYVFAHVVRKGLSTLETLSSRLPGLITSLELPKGMRWGQANLRFVRPIRWLVALYGDQVVEFNLGGVLSSGRTSVGLRSFAEAPVRVPSAEAYLETLRKALVIVDHREREEMIRSQVEERAREIGGRALLDEDLLREVTHLVEYPLAFVGSFDPEFLQLPRDVLVTAMKHHQRYFAVGRPPGPDSASGKPGLLPHFIAVRNGTSYAIETVRAGNERVLRARLADANFFFQEDMKVPLRNRVEQLKGMAFHKDLGSMYEKTIRIRELAESIARLMGMDEAGIRVVHEAAWLCKADLTTLMVSEFPELQGTMGREYLLAQGEDGRVAAAVGEHYLPRSATDRLPSSPAGMALSLADKMDSIAGYTLAGISPSGSQDPYGIRRMATGVARIALEVSIDLPEVCRIAVEGYGGQIGDLHAAREAVWQIILQRARVVLAERGFAPDVIDAVLSAQVREMPRAVAKCEALEEFLRSPNSEDLLIAWRRSAHLSSNAEDDEVRPELFVEPVEAQLSSAITEVARESSSFLEKDDYPRYLLALAKLRPAVDSFLDGVLVMTEDGATRRNRLALLKKAANLLGAEYALDKIKPVG